MAVPVTRHDHIDALWTKKRNLNVVSHRENVRVSLDPVGVSRLGPGCAIGLDDGIRRWRQEPDAN
jgi:hypothetical protein